MVVVANASAAMRYASELNASRRQQPGVHRGLVDKAVYDYFTARMWECEGWCFRTSLGNAIKARSPEAVDPQSRLYDHPRAVAYIDAIRECMKLEKIYTLGDGFNEAEDVYFSLVGSQDLREVTAVDDPRR